MRTYDWNNDNFGDLELAVFDPNPILGCGLTNLTATTTCSAYNEFTIEVSFDGNGAIFTIEDAAGNVAPLTGQDPANSPISFGPFPSGTPVDINVFDPNDATCLLSVAAIDTDCFCFGQAPVNDLCADAITLDLTLAGDTLGPFTNECGLVTSDEPATPPACFNNAIGADGNEVNFDHSVWFSFVGDGNVYNIETTPCGSLSLGGTINDDTEIQVYTGACGALVEVADQTSCDQDASYNGFYSLITEFVTTPGETYYVVVDNWASATDGEFCFFLEDVTPVCDLLNFPAIASTDCISNTEFNLVVEFQGSGASYDLVDDQGGAVQSGPAGTYTFGPYAAGTSVSVNISDPAIAGCAINTAPETNDCVCFMFEPSNDDCIGAIDLDAFIDPAGGCSVIDSTLTQVSNQCASSSTPEEGAPSTDCFDGDSNPLDIWYSFTAPATDLTWNMLVFPGFSSFAELYEGSCGALTQVPSVSCSNAGVQDWTGLTVGNTYYIRLWDFGSDQFGQHEFCLSFCPTTAANDACADATAITAPALGDTPVVNGPFDNTCATADAADDGTLPYCFFDGSFDRTMWYTFTGDGSLIDMEVVPCGAPGGADLTDSQLAIFTGSCGAFTEVACDDDGAEAPNYGFNSLISGFQTVAGENYTVLVDGFGTASGEYCIEIRNVTPVCDLQDNPVLVGTTCTSGAEFTVQVFFEGSDASYEVSDDQGSAVQTGPSTGNGGSYTFGPYPVNTDITITVSNPVTLGCVVQADPVTADCLCFGSNPANDLCADAIDLDAFIDPTGACSVIDNSLANTDNTCATTSTPLQGQPSADCVDGDAAPLDMWYTFTAISPSMTFEFLLVPGFSSFAELYEGSCGALTQVASATCSNSSSQDYNGLTVGNTYFIRMWDFGSDQFGPHEFCFTFCPTLEANDECPDAIALNVGTIAYPEDNGPYSNTCSTPGAGDIGPACWIETAVDNSVWFSVQGTGGDITIETIAGTNNDTQLVIYDACGGNEVGCDDDGGDGFMSIVTFPSVAGVTYYAMVDGFGGTEGDFQVRASSTTPPCSIQATSLLGDCDNDGNFEVTLNVFAQDLIGTMINISDDAGNDYGDFEYIDPFVQTTVMLVGDNYTTYNLILSAVDEPSCNITLDPIGPVDCPIVECPSLFTASTSTNTVCNGDEVTFSAMLTPSDASNAVITIQEAGSGSVLIPSLYGPDANGMYTASANLNYDSCGPLTQSFDIIVTCTDDNSVVAIQTEDITIYPNNIEQYITITADSCSAVATIDPSCAGFIDFDGPSSFTANEGESGTWDVCYEYFSNSVPGCFDPTGCISVSYDCPLPPPPPCDWNAGVLSSAVQFACDGEFINSPVTGAVVDNGAVLVYVLHDGALPGGNIYGSSASGAFDNNGQYPRNVELCISAVVGFPQAGGIPDFADDCTEVSANCTPVVFLEPVVIEHDFVCNEVTGEFDVTFTISGGGPGFAPDVHTYNVSGDYINAFAEAGVAYSFGPLPDNSTYNIFVTEDGKGCAASVTAGPVQCEKLPVELISYIGEVKADGNLLKWQTATEINNDYFTLEHSTDGVNFSTLEYINGAGTISTIQSYEFLHKDAPAGLSYYRLSQTDFDGTTYQEGVVSLTRGETMLQLTNILPNPATDLVTVSFSSTVEQVSIDLTDLTGRSLRSEIVNTVNGLNTYNINIESLAAGIYFITITDGQFKATEKLIKE